MKAVSPGWLEKIQEMFRWFYPGLGVKRWLTVTLLGLLVSFTAFLLLESFYDKEASFSTFLQKLPISFSGSILLFVLGLILLLWGLQQTGNAIADLLLPHREKCLIKELYLKRHLEKGPKIVALGGGTGLSVLIRGLKEYTSNLTAVVTVTDDGGSSGRLRSEMGMLPPGDLRNCLLALADTEPLLEKLFQHRFQGSKNLEGHNFGNLLIAAMTEMMGFEQAIQEFSNVLAIRGKVLPVTLQQVVLAGEFVDGDRAVGETNIVQKNKPIQKLSLLPTDCIPLPEVLNAIKKADAIILGPGSLYTSVLPNLLVPGIKEAMRASNALCLYVCNIMTQMGETGGLSASQHLQVLEAHGCKGLLDGIIINTDTDLPPGIAKKYFLEGAIPVEVDAGVLSQFGLELIKAPLLQKGSFVRHDSHKLAITIMEKLLERETGLEGLWAYTLLNRHFRRTRKKMGAVAAHPFSSTQKKLLRLFQRTFTKA